LFNTAGNYVAFLSGTNVFTPTGTWIGVVTHGNQFYDTQGEFKGYVLSDDRVAFNPTEPRKPKTFRPPRPASPFLPLRPLRRLRMLPVPPPYKDLFAEMNTTGTAPDMSGRPANFNQFLDGSLYAPDGKFLGNINTNRFDSNSLTNQFSDYGSKYNSASIFNQYGEYGSPYGANSPFNRYGQPVRIIKDGKVLGEMTKNTYYQNRIDPDDFLKWLSTL
jgi:hypothetical protein